MESYAAQFQHTISVRPHRKISMTDFAPHKYCDNLFQKFMNFPGNNNWFLLVKKKKTKVWFF